MTVTRDFQQVAGSLPLPLDYAKEVTALYNAFPEAKEKLFFLKVGKDVHDLVYPGEDKKKIMEMLGENDLLREAISDFRENGTDGIIHFFPPRGYKCILLRPFDENAASNASTEDGHAAESAFDRYWHYYAFDHETGHGLVWKAAEAEKNYRECAADVYGLIRHIQRFGNNTNFIEDRLNYTAANLFFSVKDMRAHFTTPALEKLLEDSRRIDFSTLSPEDSLHVASRYARTYALHPVMLDRLALDFLPSDDAVENLHRFARLVLATPCPEIFKYGAMALRCLMNNDFRFAGQSGPVAKDLEWHRIMAELKKREKQYCAEGDILFGIRAERFPSPATKKAPSPKDRLRLK